MVIIFDDDFVYHLSKIKLQQKLRVMNRKTLVDHRGTPSNVT